MEMINLYKEKTRKDPDDADAYFLLGIHYSKIGMYREAIEASKQAIRIDPDDALAHRELGSYLFNIK
jgi:tetratricopeptide (TPR) repeat protein